MVKKIRIPLTDINGIENHNGVIRKWDLSNLSNEVTQNQKEKMVEVTKRIMETTRSDGKSYIEGFGWVTY